MANVQNTAIVGEKRRERENVVVVCKPKSLSIFTGSRIVEELYYDMFVFIHLQGQL